MSALVYAAPLRAEISQGAAQAFLDRWLSAQNRGDFAAYLARRAPRHSFDSVAAVP